MVCAVFSLIDIMTTALVCFPFKCTRQGRINTHKTSIAMFNRAYTHVRFALHQTHYLADT